jgi:hypothetical protein
MNETEFNLKIKYRILHADSLNKTIAVRYYTDILDENYFAAEFNVDGTIKLDDEGKPKRCKTDYNLTYDVSRENILNGKVEQNDIIKFIETCAPKLYLENQTLLINSNTDCSIFEEMIGFEKTFENKVLPEISISGIAFVEEQVIDMIEDCVEKTFQIFEEKFEEKFYEKEQNIREYVEFYVDNFNEKKDT